VSPGGTWMTSSGFTETQPSTSPSGANRCTSIPAPAR
jgi:hypothetical protein